MADASPSGTLTDPAQAGREVEAPASEPPDSDAYELDGELARGGMGRIWRARDRRLDRPVAVKQLLRVTPELVRLFEREVRITARLQHPSIVSVYEAGSLPTGEPFFAMKLVAGRSLKEVVREAGSRDRRLALLPAVIAVADALAYAHEQGVIHRDLKPSNVLVGDFGETVVIDWGLAKEIGATDDSLDEIAGSPAADASRLAGTPSYMAPEVAEGAAADARADVYAIGAILYEVLAGAPAYSGKASDEVLERVRSGPPPALDDRQPGLPRDLTAIVDKAMARDPSRRYPSARELAAELRRFQTGQLVSAHRYSLRERLRRWTGRHRAAVVVAAAAAALLLVLSLVGVQRIVRERDRARFRADRLALAALDELQADSTLWGAARIIAADALHRGIVRVVYREGDAPIVAVAATAAGARVVVSTGDALRVVDSPADGWPPLVGHAGGVQAVAISPDGGFLASADADGRVRMWSLAGGRGTLVIEVAGPRPPFADLAVAGDGSAVAVAGRDGTLQVWATRGGDGRPLLDRRDTRTTRIALAPGGRRLAMAGGDGRVRILDLDGDGDGDGAVVARSRSLTVLAFSPSGEQLAVGGGRLVRLVRPGGGDPIELGHDAEVVAVAFAPAGGLVATGSADGLLRVWNREGELVGRFAGHRGAVRRLAFASDGGEVVSSGDDHQVRVWPASPRDQRVVPGHSGWGSALAFAGDDLVISAGWDHRVLAHHLSTAITVELGAHAGAIHTLVVVPRAGWAATGGDDRTVRRWQLPAGPGQVLGSHLGAVLSLAAPDDGAFLISGGADHAVRLWSPAGDREIARAASPVHTVAVDRDGDAVLWAASETAGLYWPRRDQGAALRGGDAGAPTSMVAAISPDGRWAALGDRYGAVTLWWIEPTQAGVERRWAGAGVAVRALAFAGDGERIAWVTADGTARVAVTAGQGEVALVGHRDLVRRLVFSPDGGRLASAGDDGTVRIWDVATGEGRALAHSGWVADVGFSPDGASLASLGADGALHLWRDDLPIGGAALRARLAALAAELAPGESR